MSEYEYNIQWSLYETGPLHSESWTEDKERTEYLYDLMKAESGWRRVKLVRRRKPGPIEIVKED